MRFEFSARTIARSCGTPWALHETRAPRQSVRSSCERPPCRASEARYGTSKSCCLAVATETKDGCSFLMRARHRSFEHSGAARTAALYPLRVCALQIPKLLLLGLSSQGCLASVALHEARLLRAAFGLFARSRHAQAGSCVSLRSRPHHVSGTKLSKGNSGWRW